MSDIFQVAVANITPLWPQIEPILMPALALSSTHDIEDVRRSLLGQGSHLWVQWDGERVEAAVISEFVHYPRGIWVRAWLAGARDDAKMHERGFYDALIAWCKMHGCVGFEAIGRHGWMRKFPKARAEGLVMRMEIT